MVTEGSGTVSTILSEQVIYYQIREYGVSERKIIITITNNYYFETDRIMHINVR